MQRDAAIDDIAAGVRRLSGARHLGVETPFQRAGPGIERVDDAVGTGRVHRAVDHQRRGLGAAVDIDLVGPGQTQLADIAGVDAVERAVTLVVIAAAAADPVAGLAVGIRDSGSVDLGDRRGGGRRGGGR